MPYITKQERQYYDVPLEILKSIKTPGQLNYIFTMLAIAYLNNNTECYQSYNDILGALEGCKLELYRRKTAPYEDKKIKENSDVYMS